MAGIVLSCVCLYAVWYLYPNSLISVNYRELQLANVHTSINRLFRTIITLLCLEADAKISCKSGWFSVKYKGQVQYQEWNLMLDNKVPSTVSSINLKNIR